MAKHPVSLKVNGDEYDLLIEPRKTLLAVLRDTIGLTGTKEGCSTGDCGACTVIVEGQAVTSCMVLGVTASEKEITTIEGLASDGELHPVQQAFINTGGYQCGFCTPRFHHGIESTFRRKSGEDRRRIQACTRREYLPLHRIHKDP